MNKVKQIWPRMSLLLIFLCSGATAFARPGGGGGFSSGGGGGGFSSGGSGFGGSGFSSGGGSGGGSPLMIALIVGGVIVVWLIRYLKEKSNQTVTSSANNSARSYQMAQSDASVQFLKMQSPDFSKTMFLDFASSLYHKYLHWFGEEEMKTLEPFLGAHHFQRALEKVDFNISEIVVGSIRIRFASMQTSVNHPYIEVEVDANYTKSNNQKSYRHIVTERWKFVPTGEWPPQKPITADAINCQNCGAPSVFNDSGHCESCGTLLTSGRMNWKVVNMTIVKSSQFQTGSLTTYAPEVGTDDMTLFQPSLQTNIQSFTAQYGIADWYEYERNFMTNVVRHAFMEIYLAWSDGEWSRVRHLVSDRLYESNEFWMNNYKAQGLRNKLDDIAIIWMTVVSIDLDPQYEAFTLRIKASCKDYVVGIADGQVKGGSATKDREFTEYWTFVRRTGMEKEHVDLKNCPNCGAQADKMGESAICGYCGTKVNTGQHSWILSSMTQDEVYAG